MYCRFSPGIYPKLSTLAIALGPLAVVAQAQLVVPPSENVKIELIKDVLPPQKSGSPNGRSYTGPSLTFLIQFPNIAGEQQPSGVAFLVRIRQTRKKVLQIEQVHIRRPKAMTSTPPLSSTSPYTKVLEQLGVAENYVAYHDAFPGENLPYRWFDTRFNDFGTMVEITQAELPSTGGTLWTFPGDAVPRMASEVRDTGIAWTRKGGNFGVGLAGRGMEVIFWSCFDTGNYDFIYQYGFRSDGTITARVGSTGWNINRDPHMPHDHVVLWRIDADICGKDNSFHETQHIELPPGPIAFDDHMPFNNDLEGTVDHDPFKFTAIAIESMTYKNAHGSPMTYELSPFDRKGTGRCYDGGVLGHTEKFTQHDFWASVYHAGEEGTGSGPINDWMNVWHEPDSYLLKYIANDASLSNGVPEPLNGPNTDLVLWHTSFAHHHPVDEDRKRSIGGTKFGNTLIHWQGFDLMPHNFFDYNPLCPVTP